MPDNVAASGSSDRVRAMADELVRLVEAEEAISDDAVQALTAAATRLYSTAVGRTGVEIPLDDAKVTATDAVVVCCAILRGQDLNPFDLTLWFGRVNSAEGLARQGDEE